MTEKIKDLFRKPPGLFVRIAPTGILIILITGSILLNYSKITQRIYLPGNINQITHTNLASPYRTQIIISASLQKKRILLKDPSALLRVVNATNGSIDEISLRGIVDSFNYKNRKVFFSCDAPERILTVLSENSPVTLQLEHVETTYFEIIRSKF